MTRPLFCFALLAIVGGGCDLSLGGGGGGGGSGSADGGPGAVDAAPDALADAGLPPPYGAWLATEVIGLGRAPDVAVSRNGDLFVTYTGHVDTPGVWVRRWDGAAGRWDPGLRISEDTNEDWRSFVAADDDGDAMVVWMATRAQRGLHVARFDHGGGWPAGWSQEPLVAVAADGFLDPTDLAMSGDGHAIVAWQHAHENHASDFAPGRGWSPPRRVSTVGSTTTMPRVAIVRLPDEVRAVVAWTEVVDRVSAVRTDLLAVDPVTHAGTWSGSTRVDRDPGGDKTFPEVALDARGRATVSYEVMGPGRSTGPIEVVVHDGGWGVPQVLDPDAEGEYPALAVDERGDAVVAWERWRGASRDLVYRRRVGGEWQPLAQASAMGDIPAVALAGGHGLLVWTQLAGDDVWGRALAPGGALATTALGVSASAQDGWVTDVALDATHGGLAAWERVRVGGVSGTLFEIAVARYQLP